LPRRRTLMADAGGQPDGPHMLGRGRLSDRRR
jgi:hypothetical protein